MLDMHQVDTNAAYIGAVKVTLSGIRSASTLSGLTPALARPVSGTWGERGPPIIVAARAWNSGGQVLCLHPLIWSGAACSNAFVRTESSCCFS
jgi:hypothetical protein